MCHGWPNGSSQTSSGPTLDYAPRPEFDAGVFVARYLQASAWLSIALMIIGPILFDELHVDWSFIFLFWAARALRRHSSTARKWVIALSGLVVVTACLLVVMAAISGTAEMSIGVFGRRITSPPMWQLLSVVAAIVVLAGIPFYVLLTPRARRQFQEAANKEGLTPPPRLS